MKVSAGEDFYDLRRCEIGARNDGNRHEHGDRKTRETHGMSQRGECEHERRGKSHQGCRRQHGIGPAAPCPTPGPDDEDDKDLGRYRFDNPRGAKSALPRRDTNSYLGTMSSAVIAERRLWLTHMLVTARQEPNRRRNAIIA